MEIASKNGKRPLAYIMDDDEMICRGLSAFLNELGIDSQFFLEPELFLNALKELKPRICFVDINIKESDLGYTIVQAIRSQIGFDLPLVVISARSDSHSVSHALELGANNYLVKPFDLRALESKIEPFFDGNEMDGNAHRFKKVPEESEDARISFEYEVDSINEYGVNLRGKHLIGKDIWVRVSSDTLNKINGEEFTGSLKVVRSELEPESGDFITFAEFDAENENLANKVRNWLSKQINS